MAPSRLPPSLHHMCQHVCLHKHNNTEHNSSVDATVGHVWSEPVFCCFFLFFFMYQHLFLLLCPSLRPPCLSLFVSCSLPFTYPSPQASHSSTLTPRNYTNSLSGRQCEQGWREGRERHSERKSAFVRPPTPRLFLHLPSSRKIRKAPFKQEEEEEEEPPSTIRQNVFTLRRGPNPAIEMNRVILMWIWGDSLRL